MEGIVYSSGTAEENQAAARAEDDFVFSVLYPEGAPGTYRYADEIRHPNGVTYAYPVDEASKPILEAASRGPIVELVQSEWFPPPVMP